MSRYTPDQKAIVLFLNEKKGWHRVPGIREGSKLPLTNFDNAFEFLNRSGYLNRQDVREYGDVGNYLPEFCLNSDGEKLANLIQDEADKDLAPKLMAAQLDLVRDQIKELRERPSKEKKSTRNAVILALGSVTLGCILTGVITQCQKDPLPKTIEFPKIVLLRDTIYLARGMAGQDTILVRVVPKLKASTQHSE